MHVYSDIHVGLYYSLDACIGVYYSCTGVYYSLDACIDACTGVY